MNTSISNLLLKRLVRHALVNISTRKSKTKYTMSGLIVLVIFDDYIERIAMTEPFRLRIILGPIHRLHQALHTPGCTRFTCS